jgi:MFS family permease
MHTTGTSKADDQNGLRYQTREGAFCAMMQGGGETYLSAFALLLHANPFQLGLLAALPPLLGTCSQLLSVKILDRIRARRPLILTGAVTQAASWLPLFVLPALFPEQAIWLFLLGVTMCIGMGSLSVPAWNSLITDLVHPDKRGVYFGRRAKVVGVSSFAALAVGGLILQAAEHWSQPTLGFGLVFAGAGLARLISSMYLARLQEPPVSSSAGREQGLMEFLRYEPNRALRRFLVFSGAFHVAANVAGPFFVLYLLRDLHLSYLQYGLWLAAPIVGQSLTLKEWGRLGDKFGNRQVLLATGFMVPFTPMLYLCSTHWIALVVINLMSGATWAGFSLSLQNYVFDIVPSPGRAKAVAVYNGVNAFGTAAGAMLGSALAMVCSAQLSLFGFEIPLVSNLPVVFLVSGLLRLLVSVTLLQALPEGRAVTPISSGRFVYELPLVKSVAAVFGVRPATTLAETALVQARLSRRL